MERETHGLARSFAANYTWHFQTLINSSLGTQAGRPFSSPAPGRWATIAGAGGDPNFTLSPSPEPCPQGHSGNTSGGPRGSVASPAGGPRYQCSRLTGASQEQL